MKLLRRNEINTLKASERRNEIETGLAIAKRVDGLREVLSEEESNLDKFRTETVKIVQKEVDGLIVLKESLQYEIGVLERQSLNLNRPFDEEWELVRMKRLSDLDAKLEDVERREKELSRGEYLFSFRENDLKIIESRAKDESDRSERLLVQASKERADSREILNRAKLEQARIYSEIDAKTNEYNKKESEWVFKEKDLSMREEAIRRSVRELARREKFINDKYATMLRTEKALSNKK